MFSTILLLLLQFSFSAEPAPSSFELEVSSGLGGVTWETEYQPKINSNIGIVFGYRKHWKNYWWWGTSLIFNSYSGDSEYHRGPGAVLGNFMIYRKFKVDLWTLFLGVGSGLSFMTSERNLEEDPKGLPDGEYSIFRAGINMAVHIMLIHKIHPRLSVTMGFRGQLVRYSDSCWEGPVTDCSEVDPFMQHWFVGVGVIYSAP